MSNNLTFAELVAFEKRVKAGSKDPEPTPLHEVAVRDLPAALADVDDLGAVLDAQELDHRSTAQRHYEARIHELEG